MEPLQRSLVEMAERIQELYQQLPDEWDSGTDLRIDNLVADIEAIESEWIIDPQQRRELSCIEGD